MLNFREIIKPVALACQRQLKLAMPVLVLLGVILALTGIWWLGSRWVWRGISRWLSYPCGSRQAL